MIEVCSPTKAITQRDSSNVIKISVESPLIANTGLVGIELCVRTLVEHGFNALHSGATIMKRPALYGIRNPAPPFCF